MLPWQHWILIVVMMIIIKKMKNMEEQEEEEKGIPDSPSRTTSVSRVYLYLDWTVTRMLGGREPPLILL